MEPISDKLRNFINRLSGEAKRTSGLMQAKMELNKLQAELDKKECALGRKVSLLNRRGTLKDKFLLEALAEELEILDECEKRVEIALREIQELTAINLSGVRLVDSSFEADAPQTDSGLDSFEVG